MHASFKTPIIERIFRFLLSSKINAHILNICSPGYLNSDIWLLEVLSLIKSFIFLLALLFRLVYINASISFMDIALSRIPTHFWRAFFILINYRLLWFPFAHGTFACSYRYTLLMSLFRYSSPRHVIHCAFSGL